jgi:glycosyltransferase involved in cell wall biosynthesis
VAIRRLLDNPVFAHALGERGRKVVRERYTWDLIYRKTDLIYRVVTGQSPAGLADVERLQ